MKITRKQLRRIIKEERAKILKESNFKARHGDIESSILGAVDMDPGISGMELVKYVVSDSSEYGHEVPVAQEEVFAVLDNMLEDGTIFFNEEEDAWFEFEEDLIAHRDQGGVWSDEKDYEAGWYR